MSISLFRLLVVHDTAHLRVVKWLEGWAWSLFKRLVSRFFDFAADGLGRRQQKIVHATARKERNDGQRDAAWPRRTAPSGPHCPWHIRAGTCPPRGLLGQPRLPGGTGRHRAI